MKTSTLKNNKDMIHFNLFNQDELSGRKSRFLATRQLLHRVVAICLLLVGSTAWAADYLIKSGSYYIGMNAAGTGLQAYTTPDASCVWTCLDGTTETTLSTTSRSMRNKKNSSYYLYAKCERSGFITGTYTWTLSVATSASAVWRGNNNNFYAYASENWWSREASISATGATSITLSDDDNDISQYYAGSSHTSETTYTGGLNAVNVTNNTLSYNSNLTASLTSEQRKKNVTPEYTDFNVSSTHYYWYNNTLSTTQPTGTPTDIALSSYSWSITGAGADYLTLASTTGATNTITYSTPSPNDGVTATISVTANYAEGESVTKTTTINLNKYTADPTTIVADNIAVVAGGTETLNPTLTCAIPGYTNIYKSLTYSSTNTSIATVTDAGVVTGLAEGTTTITITATLQGGGTITKNITVTVAQRAATPTITFDNTTGELTMATTTTGGVIHYTLDGSNPTSTSSTYNASSKPQLTQGATVKAITTADGYVNSLVGTLEVGQVGTPTISVSGTTVTLGCATTDVTYYYTTDGTDPSFTSTSTTSTTLTTIPSGSTLKVMAVKNGMVNSAVASKEVMYKLATPTITISSGQVTMSSTDADVAIHYTTDGSEPTASSATYSTALTATNGMTYKAIAVKTNYINSDIASEQYMIPSGISGGTVILNDYEDHTWTYYAGVDASVDGGNYNTNYAGKMYSPDPRNVKITYKANGGAVSITETETEFVYYKTIEKVDGTYKYQVISNPFSKRPMGKGFGGWKIIDGGEYIQGKNDNDLLVLDEELTLTGLDNNYTTNCTSAEIELQATWVNATITNITSNSNATIANNGTYETNIVVIKCNYNKTLTINGPCTIMMVEPDGSIDYRTNTFTGSIEPPSGGIAKIEFSTWDPSASLAIEDRNLWVGRGVDCITTQNVTASNGGGSINQILKIESGTFGTFTHYSGSITGSSFTKQHVYLGCDYDRATDDNTKLTFTGRFEVGRCDGGSNYNIEACRVYSKSGSFMTGTTISSAERDNSYYFSRYTNSSPQSSRYFEIEGGDWYANIAGGQDYGSTANNYIPFRFRMKGGRVRGAIYGAAEQSNINGARVLVITGGKIGGWIAGGANGTKSGTGKLTGSTYVYVGGTADVNSNHQMRNNSATTAIRVATGGYVFGSGVGYNASSHAGEVTVSTNVVFGDNASVEHGVYGGGTYGYSSGTANVYITGVGHVESLYDSQANAFGGVYGGARQNDGGTVNVYMTGGQIDGVTNSGNHGGGLFGGSNASGTIDNSVKMVVTGGQVGTTSTTANIHGGGYGNSTRVLGSVNLTVGESGATEGATIYGDVYGGSAEGKTNGNTSRTANAVTNVTLNAGTINGSLYGGGLGTGSYAADVYGPVQVTVNGGSVKKTTADGSGGVYGCNNINGEPKSTVFVDVYGTAPAPAENQYALFSVYGGGNKADYDDQPVVTIHNCGNSIEYVYGGGNAAAVASTDVTIYGGNKIGNVFGGGNGESGTAADVTDDEVGTYVMIFGGTIGNVYGGSNKTGTISGPIEVRVEAYEESCPIAIENVYGGGNQAASNAGTVVIGCTGEYVEASGSTPESGYIRNVYGGANQADITGNIGLTIKAGHIDNVFGGNNNSGTINGTITVTVKEDLTNYSCGMLVGNVYGGGNKAAYGSGANYPVVKIEKGHLTGSVFGGGLGSTAVVTGNPQVTIGSTTSTDVVTIDGNVFGGGDAANVAGSPVVLVQNCNTTIGTTSTTGGVTTYTKGDVYGGGNAAHVTGSSNSTSVTINGGTINRVFGGGNGEVSAANVEGSANTTIHGGTIHQAFAGSNAAGTISGTAKITVDKTGSCDETIDEVYGGGNLAAGKAGTVDIKCGATVGDVYGGANQADVTSAITLDIIGGTISRVFGGNNTSGNITGAITVNIDKASTCESFSVQNVYGAGNKASYTPTTLGSYPAVNIKNGTVSQNVYGGGLGSSATVTSNPVVTLMGGSVTGNIFGGGDAAPVTGNPAVVANYGSTTNIYAGGKGSTAIVTGNPTATINKTADKDLTITDVFGGGDAAGVTGNTTVNLTAGSVTRAFGGGNLAAITGTTAVNLTGATAANVYGGGNEAGVSSTATVAMSAGSVTGGLYGGCNSEGKVDGVITVGVTGGTIGTSTTPANVHGGGYGSSTETGGNVAVTINGATIYGDVYGGSALGSVNDASTETTTVTLTSGTINGDLYGGGLGDNTYAAGVAGSTVVAINGGTVNNVFGCNNANGAPTTGASVTVNGGTINNNVYGGGNLAAASVSPVVTINNGTLPGSVFGGGKGAPSDASHETAMVTGNPQVVIGDDVSTHSVSIAGNVFGGGDAANVKGATTVTVNKCNTLIGAKTSGAWSTTAGTVYGGGNAADVVKNGTTGGSTSVVVNGGDIYRVFGGGNGEGVSNPGANVANGTSVDIHAGNIHQAFAGSNAKGNITGTSIVTIDHDISACDELIDEVYGGGNLAAGNAGEITVECGAVIGDLYGGANQADIGTSTNPSNITLNVTGGTINRVFGGNNTSGNIYGSITVNVEKADDCGLDLNYVYGAGNQASYAPTTAGAYPAVNILKGTVKKDVFGGGLGSTAVVTSNPAVKINGGSVTGNVFGGGSAANVKGNTTVTLTTGAAGSLYGGGEAASVLANGTTYPGNTSVSVAGGTVGNSIYGGGLGNTTTVAGNVAVSVSGGAITKDVYGGSGFGTVNTNENNTTTVTISGGTITQDVYGGGFGQIASGTNPAYEANVNGDVSVIINGGSMRCVFGCNNANGAPQEDVAVTVNGGTISANIYGGGNLAAASVSPVVTINNGTFAGSVFGGGKGDPADATHAIAMVTGNPLVTIGNNDDDQHVTIRGNVFGGGDAANVAGKPKVVINDCATIIGTYTGSGESLVWSTTDGTVYGGGNAADITGSGNGTDVTINGGMIHRAFGGGNGAGTDNPGANVAGNTLLTIKGGTVGEAFGGSNARGTIGGTPNVVIDDAVGDCPLSLLDLYGGGNETPSEGGHLIVKGCKHIRNVYGGANNANITSDIEVTIKSGYIQNVFGGNNNGGNITGSIIVNIDWDGSDCWNVDNVYGAGNLATYTAPTTSTYGDKAGKFPEVNIKNGKVNYNVFGAGKGDGSKFGSTEVYKGQVTGNPQVKLIGGSCKNIYGGGEGAPVNGNTNVTINATDRPANEGEYHVEECVFGGGLGATAVINGSTNITITGSSAIHGNVYGGGNAGLVTGDTHIDIK